MAKMKIRDDSDDPEVEFYLHDDGESVRLTATNIRSSRVQDILAIDKQRGTLVLIPVTYFVDGLSYVCRQGRDYIRTEDQ